MYPKIKKAVIPAAGYGTRFLPVTKSIPKEMLPIVDTPTIEYIIREAYESGITDFLIIVSSNKNSILDYFDRNFELESLLTKKKKTKELELICDLPDKINVHYIRQKEQLGLGHAVLCAKAFCENEPFALLLGDDVYVGKDEPALKQMIDVYDDLGKSIIGTIEVNKEDVSKYGIVEPVDNETGKLLKLKSVVEKPALKDAPSRLAIGGRYILTPEIFTFLETQNKGKGDEIQLTDSILRMMSTQDVYALNLEAKRYDIGTKIGFVEATIDFALKDEELKNSVYQLLKQKIKDK